MFFISSNFAARFCKEMLFGAWDGTEQTSYFADHRKTQILLINSDLANIWSRCVNCPRQLFGECIIQISQDFVQVDIRELIEFDSWPVAV